MDGSLLTENANISPARSANASRWLAIQSIAGKIGCTGETLRQWVRRYERDSGLRDGMTTADREGLVHHSDRGVQYLSLHYTDRLLEAGVVVSVGSVGDSYDNALAIG